MTYQEVFSEINDVFGVNESSIASIIERTNLNNQLTESLIEKKSIIIYGGSKQGKTTLLKQKLNESEYLNVQCTNFKSIDELYKLILDLAGYDLEINKSAETTNKQTISGSAEFSGNVPLVVTAKGGGSVSAEENNKVTFNYQSKYSNLSVAQNIIELLREIQFKKIIKLENFHYISDEIQTLLAQDLRTFSENNILFIILGVWKQQDSIFVKNMDLNGRVKNIAVEPWTKKEFEQIIYKGTSILNISIPRNLIDYIIDNSFGNVGLVQDICKYSIADALQNGENTKIVSKQNITHAIDKIASSEKSRLEQILEKFLQVNSIENDLNIPYFLCRSLMNLDPKSLYSGVSIKETVRNMKEDRKSLYPDSYNTLTEEDLVNYLIKLKDKQKESSHNFTPLIDFNGINIGAEISIIDKYFLFSLHHLTLEDFDTITHKEKKSYVIKNTNSDLEEKLRIANQKIKKLEDELGEKEISETIKYVDDTPIDYQEPTDAELEKIQNDEQF